MVHLKEGKVPGHGVGDTCSFAGLFPGVRRSSVSFVFSFKILILAMKPGYVELLSPQITCKTKKKKKRTSSDVLKMTALLSFKIPSPKLPRICNLSLSFLRREKGKRKSVLGDT